MRWPVYHPEGCPPPKAFPPNGTFYRLVSSDPIDSSDFLPHTILFPNRPFPDKCIACGLSTYTNPDDVRRLKKRVPAFQQRLVAVGQLSDKMGKVLLTPSSRGEKSHHTWWIPEGLQCWDNFSIVEIEP